MREFLMRGTQAEKKGAEGSCLPINIIDIHARPLLFTKIGVSRKYK
jgi:hypothetical protein